MKDKITLRLFATHRYVATPDTYDWRRLIEGNEIRADAAGDFVATMAASIPVTPIRVYTGDGTILQQCMVDGLLHTVAIHNLSPQMPHYEVIEAVQRRLRDGFDISYWQEPPAQAEPEPELDNVGYATQD